MRRDLATYPGRVRDPRRAGYQPEIAYFECLHELKLIVDLLYEGGFTRHAQRDLGHRRVRRPDARHAASSTNDVEAAMQKILDDIRSGEFAREWVLENKAGTPVLDAERRAQAEHQIEEVGERS